MAASDKDVVRAHQFILIIGDLHIPDRAHGLPDKFKELLVPGVISHVICTGNVGNQETLSMLRAISDNFTMVRGDCDDVRSAHQNEALSLKKKLQIRGIRFGVIHGHQVIPWEDEESLKSYQRELGCDMLIHGHSHKQSIKKLGDHYFVNPGSATGAYSTLDQ